MGCYFRSLWLDSFLNLFVSRLFSEGGNFCPENVQLIALDIDNINEIIIAAQDSINKQLKIHRKAVPEHIHASIKDLRDE